jgi:uncharacterized protein (TIGR00299 family) protein
MPHDHHDHDSDNDHKHDHKHERSDRPTPVYSVPPSASHARANDAGRTTSVHPASRNATTSENKEPLARGAGRGKVLFIDAFSGIAGDMLVGALIDLGVPEQMLRDALSTLPLEAYDLRLARRDRGGISALALDVIVHKEQPSRDYAAICALIERAVAVPEGARTLALRAFAVLAEAEAAVHGVRIEDVHFHEVGAVDSIVDIVAASVALDYLGATVMCSPLPMGRGFTRSAHGPLPLPAPATINCLRGVPTCDAGIDGELVTPTGACLVRAAAKSFTRWPALSPLRIGFGAGTRELSDRPNVLRVVLGDAAAEATASAVTHRLIELNVDDLTGELAAVAVQAAFDAGALDVWTTPIGMKKGRPALMISALAPVDLSHEVGQALLRESSSLGLRIRDISRIERPRRMVKVQTEFGAIALKIADGDDLPELAAPEYEDCRIAAETHRIPVRQAYAAAIAAYWSQRSRPK